MPTLKEFTSFIKCTHATEECDEEITKNTVKQIKTID